MAFFFQAAASFSPVPGGFIFRAPRAWIFGPTRYYRVTAIEQAEIATIMTKRQPLLTVTVSALAAILMICLMLGAPFLVPDFYHGNPTVVSALVLLGLGLVAALVPQVLSLRLSGRSLRPILAGLTRKNETLTREDWLDARERDFGNTAHPFDDWNQYNSFEAVREVVERQDDAIGKNASRNDISR